MRPQRDATGVWRFLFWVANLIRPLFVRLQVDGTDNVPAAGGCVLACNHTMGPDYVLLGYTSPRQVYYMAKAEIFYFHPWLTRLLRALGTFPVRRGKQDSDAIERATEIAASGKAVGMFPEGTRSRSGLLQRGRSGVARIAIAAQVPIVPVVVIDSEPVLRDLLKLRRRPLVRVRYGRPIYPPAGVQDLAAARRLTDEMMLAMADLLPPERRGYYADPVQAAQREWELAAQEAGIGLTVRDSV